jgi:hypothetical protein
MWPSTAKSPTARIEKTTGKNNEIDAHLYAVGPKINTKLKSQTVESTVTTSRSRNPREDVERVESIRAATEFKFGMQPLFFNSAARCAV